MKLEKIEYQKLQIGSVIQAKKDGKVYYVDGLLPKITIVENGNPNNCRKLSISTLTRYYQLVVPEPVEVQEEPEEVAPVEEQPTAVEETVQQVASTVITTTITGNTGKPMFKKNRKLSDEQYLAMVEEYLIDEKANKKRIAEKYGVHPSILSDAFSDKYVRKSVKNEVEALKVKYNYSK